MGVTGWGNRLKWTAGVIAAIAATAAAVLALKHKPDAIDKATISHLEVTPNVAAERVQGACRVRPRDGIDSAQGAWYGRVSPGGDPRGTSRGRPIRIRRRCASRYFRHRYDGTPVRRTPARQTPARPGPKLASQRRNGSSLRQSSPPTCRLSYPEALTVQLCRRGLPRMCSHGSPRTNSSRV